MKVKDFSKMETVGLVRAIDDLGRVSIPVEARKVTQICRRRPRHHTAAP